MPLQAGCLAKHPHTGSVVSQGLIAGEQQQGFNPALADQEPVEGIAMAFDLLQMGHLQQMVVADHEPLKALLRDKLLQCPQVNVQPPKVQFDRQFP